ncbi:MAG: molybdopterin-dependent oxidoreductase [Burkholderiales bacterium]|jgi:tetrathionate reductase subunit A|nr:molybdopterin-dependent oxidoreductase [Burkholderiales bacterium]
MTSRRSRHKKSRRDFIMTAPAALLALGAGEASAVTPWRNPRSVQKAAATQLDAGVKVVHSVCLGCNARCGVRAVVDGGRVVKHSGNPYHPYNQRFDSQIPFDTPVKQSLTMPSPVCGKSQDGPAYVYSPYRLLRPLKRSGPRGSGRFEPIEWEQMIREIAFGGKLFAHLGEDRVVPGIKDLDSDAPIDPQAPELGPVRNGFVFIGGRDQNARLEFSARFVRGALGSVNRIGHTDICGLGFRMGNFALSEGRQVEFKADPVNAEYILVIGANIYEALQPGVNTYAATVAHRSADEKLKFTIVDPRATNASTHAENWIALKPGQDGAFAMGMIRWIIENDRLNRPFLAAPHAKAAEKIGHGCYSNATHLVVVEPGHRSQRRFLRAGDLNPALPEADASKWMVLSTDGKPVPFDSVDNAQVDSETAIEDVSGKTLRVATSFRLMKDGVFERSVAQYAELAGVDRTAIESTAREFTAHGTRAAVTQYHGAGNYLSGTYAAYPIAVLNVLIGSIDRKGGYLQPGGAAAAWNRGIYDLADFPGLRKPSGPPISRERFAYEKTTEFKNKGYPAKRPWYPFSQGGLCVEAMSGIDQQYPYGCRILFTYFFNPVYSIPGGYRYVETLKSADKVPLHVSIDITVNESNVYADYIVPDLTYAEGHYGFLVPHAPAARFTGIRTPTIEPLTGRTTDGRAFGEETLLIDLARAVGLPGFGDNAIKDKDGKLHPLATGEDFYLRAIANVAAGAKVPTSTEEEVAFVEANYPVAKFRQMLPDDQWRRVCYALARGGVFSTRYEDVFDGEKHRFGIKRVALYNETLATTRNAITGELFPGTLKYTPPRTAKGRDIEAIDAKEFPFTIVTYKMNLHTQSRTVLASTAMEVVPTNHVQVNESDAKRLGLKSEDWVRLVSRSNPAGIRGQVKVTRLVRPGVVGISFHYGHSQLGASALPIRDADKVFLGAQSVADAGGLKPNPRHSAGLNYNDVARLDEDFADTPLVEVCGGIPDFSSTRVKIIRA